VDEQSALVRIDIPRATALEKQAIERDRPRQSRHRHARGAGAGAFGGLAKTRATFASKRQAPSGPPPWRDRADIACIGIIQVKLYMQTRYILGEAEATSTKDAIAPSRLCFDAL
jgi:hypothetical protein